MDCLHSVGLRCFPTSAWLSPGSLRLETTGTGSAAWAAPFCLDSLHQLPLVNVVAMELPHRLMDRLSCGVVLCSSFSLSPIEPVSEFHQLLVAKRAC